MEKILLSVTPARHCSRSGEAGGSAPLAKRVVIFSSLSHRAKLGSPAQLIAYNIKGKEQNIGTQIALVFLISVLGATDVHARVLTKNISYQHDGVALEGYLAYEDSIKGKVPAVLIVHEWWGLNDYARNRAEQLAAMGYVAFALDMYGKGKVT
ncbi:MAG: dienelactone hydrolase family protein, partial [Deltaproteobacteria bacterium]